MSEQQRSKPPVNAQPPDEPTLVQITRPSKTAGGLPAIFSAVKHSLREMGSVRTVRTLARINQKDGFDCPGCAWPDPDGERSHAEFCENGAKHVADAGVLRH